MGPIGLKGGEGSVRGSREEGGVGDGIRVLNGYVDSTKVTCLEA